MLAISLAILLTVVYAVLSLRAGEREVSMGSPAVLLGVSAGCAAAAGFLPEPTPPATLTALLSGGAGPAELIVAPVVLGMLVACIGAVRTAREGVVRLWPAAGLVTLLGALALADRVDALNGQLLLVFGLGLMWLATDRREDGAGGRQDPEPGAAPAALAGLLATGTVGWAIVAGASPVVATGLVAANLLVWVLAQRDFSAVATASVVAVCIGSGAANISRIVGGAISQPEWNTGDRSQAIALELMSRPYVPGFSAMLPDVVLLVLGVLFAVLGTEDGTGGRRRWLVLGALMGVLAMHIAWTAIATV